MKPSITRLGWAWLAAVLASVALAFFLGAHIDAERFEGESQNAADQLEGAIGSRIVSASSELQVAGTAVTATSEDPKAFRSAARTILGDPALSAVSYIKKVGERGRRELERSGILLRSIDPDGGSEDAPRAGTYHVIVMTESVTGSKSALGVDVSSNPARRATLTAASTTKAPTLTEPIQLISTGSAGVAIYSPIFAEGSTRSRAGGASGFVVGAYELDSLADELQREIPKGTSFEIVDGKSDVIGRGDSVGDGVSREVEIAGRTWTIRVAAAGISGTPLTLLLPGIVLVLAVVMAAVVSSLRRRQRYTEALLSLRAAERDLAEDERERVRQDFSATFDESPVGIATISVTGHFTAINRSLCEILGRTPDELKPSHVWDIAGPSERDRAAISSMLKGELRQYRAEVEMKRDERESIWLGINTVLIRDSSGRPLHFLIHVEDISERHLMNQRLEALAERDELTGLLNRRGFGRELQRKLFECERYGATGALLVIDLDGLKVVNDSHGHASGDSMLLATADALRDGSRKSDVIGRLGGDEFALLLPRGDGEEAKQAAALILTRLARELRPGDLAPITASVGIVAFSDLSVHTQEAAMNAADLAMYEAKRAGGRGLAVWSG